MHPWDFCLPIGCKCFAQLVNAPFLLHDAAQYGHLPVVQHICSLLEDKNPKDANDFTPLHLGAHFGHLEIVKYLVQHVKDKHPKSGVYWGQKTPLDWAKENGHSKIVKFLTSEGNSKSSKSLQFLRKYF